MARVFLPSLVAALVAYPRQQYVQLHTIWYNAHICILYKHSKEIDDTRRLAGILNSCQPLFKYLFFGNKCIESYLRLPRQGALAAQSQNNFFFVGIVIESWWCISYWPYYGMQTLLSVCLYSVPNNDFPLICFDYMHGWMKFCWSWRFQYKGCDNPLFFNIFQ